jgi:hypothetical protein
MPFRVPFAFRLSCHSGYSNGMPGGTLYYDRSRRGLFGVLYPLLVSLADLIVCHVRLEAMDGK